MSECLECGKAFRKRQHNASFCGRTCRQVFNNRRATRGALLYDLTMIFDAAEPTSKVAENAAQAIMDLMVHWRGKRTWQGAHSTFEAVREALKPVTR